MVIFTGERTDVIGWATGNTFLLPTELPGDMERRSIFKEYNITIIATF